jgi:hypothetical protein
LGEAQAFFGRTLETIIGQALAAAGYHLQDNPTHQSRGLFRYAKPLADGVSVYVEFQVLVYQGVGPSRFRVNLLRNAGPDARSSSQYAGKIDTTLGKLLWDGFGVRQLNGPEHWWSFTTAYELAQALVEAGKLLFGFGIPWLEGTLQPGELTDGDQPPPVA